MEPVCGGIRPHDFVSEAAPKQFLAAITRAAEEYLALPDPVKVAEEIRSLEKKLRQGSVPAQHLVENLSPGAIEVIEAHGAIPDFSALSDLTEIRDASRDLLGVVTNSFRHVQQTSQWRAMHTAIGQVKRGRPPHYREQLLVGRLATAYLIATGLRPSRSWSRDMQTDFEVIVAHALDALQVPEDISAIKLAEAHIKKREAEGRGKPK